MADTQNMWTFSKINNVILIFKTWLLPSYCVGLTKFKFLPDSSLNITLNKHIYLFSAWIQFLIDSECKGQCCKNASLETADLWPARRGFSKFKWSTAVINNRAVHTLKKSTSEHLFWCFRLSQIEECIQYLEGPNSAWKDHDRQHYEKKVLASTFFLVLQVVTNKGLYSVPGRTKW